MSPPESLPPTDSPAAPPSPPTVAPKLSQIWVYPIKSLDGVRLSSGQVLPSGALRYDREWAIADSTGQFLNGKRTAKVHHLQARFDLANLTVDLGVRSALCLETFHLEADQPRLERWLSDYFEQPVQLWRDRHQGFPDDTASPGPTVISTETLEVAATWFEDMTAAELRRRLRTTLEISGGGAFWEDRLYGAAGTTVAFQIGEVPWLGVNPCLRCIVPTRDTNTGEAIAGFQQQFIQQRRETLPPWAEASRFKPYYRIAVNTRLGTQGLEQNNLQLGDPVKLRG